MSKILNLGSRLFVDANTLFELYCFCEGAAVASKTDLPNIVEAEIKKNLSVSLPVRWEGQAPIFITQGGNLYYSVTFVAELLRMLAATAPTGHTLHDCVGAVRVIADLMVEKATGTHPNDVEPQE